MNEEIVSRIQQIIDHYGLPVSAFADNIGVQRSSISHLLNGRNKPSLDFVLKLIAAYPEVDLYWLLQGKGSFPPSLDEPMPTDHKGRTATESHQTDAPMVEQVVSKSNMAKTRNVKQIALFFTDGTFEVFNPKND